MTPALFPLAMSGFSATENISAEVRNSSKMGELVLDPFGGSGSTLIACELTGRRCCTMELDPHYCDVIIERWQNLTGREAVLVEEARDGD